MTACAAVTLAEQTTLAARAAVLVAALLGAGVCARVRPHPQGGADYRAGSGLFVLAVLGSMVLSWVLDGFPDLLAGTVFAFGCGAVVIYAFTSPKLNRASRTDHER